jgi:hypothetical protein
VGAILKIDWLLLHQAEISFMYQSRSLKRMVRTFLAKVAVS